MESFLKETLEKVDKWLHYAEAKNAVATGVYLAVVIKLLETGVEGWLKGAAFILFVASLIINGLSFFPDTSKNDESQSDDLSLISNIQAQDIEEVLFYYKDITAFVGKPNTYLKKVELKYGKNNVTKHLNIDLANQIIIKSEITLRKFTLFSNSLKVFSVGLIILIVSSYSYPNTFNLNKSEKRSQNKIEVNINDFVFEEKSK